MFILGRIDCVDCQVRVDPAHGVEVRRSVSGKRTPTQINNYFKLCLKESKNLQKWQLTKSI